MKIILLIIALIIVATGSYYFLGRNHSSSPPITLPTNINPTGSPQPTVDTNQLKAGGSSYADSQGVYVLLYPADYKLDTQDKQHIRIYKTGATQRGQTEMYDGVIIVLESINLDGQPLDAWVTNYIREATADGTSKVVTPKTSIIQNHYPGFSYTLRGLGTATYYVLQKDAASPYAVSITISINDPKQVGYQNEVNTILATLELLK